MPKAARTAEFLMASTMRASILTFMESCSATAYSHLNHTNNPFTIGNMMTGPHPLFMHMVLLNMALIVTIALISLTIAAPIRHLIGKPGIETSQPTKALGVARLSPDTRLRLALERFPDGDTSPRHLLYNDMDRLIQHAIDTPVAAEVTTFVRTVLDNPPTSTTGIERTREQAGALHTAVEQWRETADTATLDANQALVNNVAAWTRELNPTCK